MNKYSLTFLLTITLFGALIYSNSFYTEFQYDDTWIIANNPDTRLFDESNKNWLNINHRGLGRLSFALNYMLNERDTWGYHLFNVIVHLLTGIFVYLLTLKLLRVRSRGDLHEAEDSTRPLVGSIIALFTALIFVAHPLQTEAVTYICQRMTSMAALFYIIAVYCYLKARMAHTADKATAHTWMMYLFGLLFGIMSVYTKQTAITFPLAFVLIELFFVRDNSGKINMRLVSGIVIGVATGALVIVLSNIATSDTQSASRLTYFTTQLRVIPSYFQMALLPFGQNIDHNFSLSNALGMKEILGLIMNLGILGAGILLLKRNYYVLSFSIFWIYLTLSVESSIFPIKDVFVEHRMYLPMLGIALFLSQVVFLLIGNRRTIAIAILAVLTAFYGILTYQRNQVWESPLTLWSDSVEKAPLKARPNNNLGHAYLSLGESDKAMNYFKKAIAIKPDYVEALNNRGLVLFGKGEYENALHDFQKALSFKPNYAPAVNNVGLAWNKLEEYGEAVNYMEKALKLDPNNPEIPYNLGVVFEKTGPAMVQVKMATSLEVISVCRILLFL